MDRGVSCSISKIESGATHVTSAQLHFAFHWPDGCKAKKKLLDKDKVHMKKIPSTAFLRSWFAQLPFRVREI